MQNILRHSRRSRKDIQTADRQPSHAAASTNGPTVDDPTPVVRAKLRPIRQPHAGQREIERRFFSSLHIFCGCYKIPVPDTSPLEYPDNVVAAFDAISAHKLPKGGSLFISSQHGRRGQIGAAKRWYSNRTVLYVPLDGFWNLQQRQQTCPFLLKMVTATLAYFKQVVKIPMYNEPSSIQFTLDSIRSWLLDDESLEEEEEPIITAIFDKADRLANPTKKILNDPASLAQWEQGLRGFIPQTDWEYEIKLCCAELQQLYKKYPKRRLDENIHSDLFPSEPDDHLYVDDITGFYFLGEQNELEDYVLDYINSSYQERHDEILPMSILYYDQPGEPPAFNLEFEDKLLHLLGQFSYTLNLMTNETANKPI